MSELSLFDVCASVQRLEALALSLPPMQEVIDAMDAKELDDERNARPIPRVALKALRPVFEAAREFQAACQASRAKYLAQKGGA